MSATQSLQAAAQNPFYLQISHYAVHVRLQALKETEAKYEKKPRGKWHSNPLFAACGEDLDTGIGMVLDKVKELGVVNPVCQALAVYVPDRPGEDVQIAQPKIGATKRPIFVGASQVR